MKNRLPHPDPMPTDLFPEVEVQSASDLISLAQIERIRSWLAEMVSAIAPEADSLGVRLVDDVTMQEFNQRYRGHDRSTDVLSFVGRDSPEGSHLGDILISAPQVRRQAHESGLPYVQELQILLIHGILHCLGYDHESDDGAMELLELEYRARWIGVV